MTKYDTFYERISQESGSYYDQKKTLRELAKNVSNLTTHVDKHINEKILKHLGQKTQAIGIFAAGILASIAIHVMILSYVNEKMLTSFTQTIKAELKIKE